MPIYEYTCKECGDFEVTQRITEPALKKCPSCDSQVSKLISQSAFHLKGAGWYATDFKNGTSSSDSKETKGETKNESKSQTKNESKGDTKPSSSTSSSSAGSSKTASSSSP